MTSSFDASRYQRALERWRTLAEQRLEHMTVLYESGRWQRYFTEEQFVLVIRESRAAVDAWQRLVPEQEGVAQLFAIAGELPVIPVVLPSRHATPLPELQLSVA